MLFFRRDRPGKKYRVVAKRKGAYAAMPVWRYRGVTSELTSETHEVSRSVFSYSLRRDRPVGLSRGNQRADFGSPRSLAIRLLVFFTS